MFLWFLRLCGSFCLFCVSVVIVTAYINMWMPLRCLSLLCTRITCNMIVLGIFCVFCLKINWVMGFLSVELMPSHCVSCNYITSVAPCLRVDWEWCNCVVGGLGCISEKIFWEMLFAVCWCWMLHSCWGIGLVVFEWSVVCA